RRHRTLATEISGCQGSAVVAMCQRPTRSRRGALSHRTLANEISGLALAPRKPLIQQFGRLAGRDVIANFQALANTVQRRPKIGEKRIEASLINGDFAALDFIPGDAIASAGSRRVE